MQMITEKLRLNKHDVVHYDLTTGSDQHSQHTKQRPKEKEPLCLTSIINLSRLNVSKASKTLEY